MGKPSFQFYPGDWLKDPALRRCSPAARGMLMDLLCFMDQSEEPGVLVANGTPWKDTEAIRACSGCTRGHLRELVDGGVLIRREGDGALVNKRMVRDAADRAKNANRQSRFRERNGKSNGHITPESQPSSSSSSSSPSGNTPQSPPTGGAGGRPRRTRGGAEQAHEDRIAALGDSATTPPEEVPVG